jgi:site-specific DNA-methyltransferase (adenine-specific)
MKPSLIRPRKRSDGGTKPGRIICGDALVELPQLATGSAQLVIADPPYFQVLARDWDRQWPDAQTYLDWSSAWLGEAMRVVREDGLLYCFGQLGKREHTFLHLMSAATQRWQFHNLITWDSVVGYNERRNSFTPATELILVLRKSVKPKFHKAAVREPYDAATIKEYLRDKRYQNQAARRRHLSAGKYATNLWRIPSLKGHSAEKCGHPAQKPLKLIERIVLSSSAPGDLVLDPFLGSGTTAVVAQQHGRRWLGIEMNPAYVKIARQRLQAKFKV